MKPPHVPLIDVSRPWSRSETGLGSKSRLGESEGIEQRLEDIKARVGARRASGSGNGKLGLEGAEGASKEADNDRKRQCKKTSGEGGKLVVEGSQETGQSVGNLNR